MTTMIMRTFESPVELRSSNNGGDGRTVFGRAVPYDYPQYVEQGLTEEFAPGAFNHQLRAANRVRGSRQHIELGGTLIGAARSLEDRPDGLHFELRVSKTAMGDETLELINDKALNQVSIGFRERPNGNVRTASGSIRRTSADLFEIAFVDDGAYGDAASVTGVRSRTSGIIVPSVAAAHGCTCCEELRQLRSAQGAHEAAKYTLPPLPVHLP